MKVKATIKLFLPLALCTACAVQAQEQTDNKIRLSIGHFRPLEAEVNKFLRPIQRESVDAAPMPITAEERAILDSGTLTMLKTQEFFAKMQARKERMRKAEEEFRKQEEQIEKLRETMYKNAENRPLFNGMKKLCARLSQYDVFKILERNDMAELLNEAGAESGEKAADVFSLARMASSYNVIVDVADLHRQEHRGNVGGVNFLDTIYTRDFIVKVQNMLDGSAALQTTVKTKKKRTLTDVGGTTDDGVVYEELVDDAVEQIAKAIYEKFVASCSFKFKPLGKIDGFEPSAITISVLDGKGETVATKAQNTKKTETKEKTPVKEARTESHKTKEETPKKVPEPQKTADSKKDSGIKINMDGIISSAKESKNVHKSLLLKPSQVKKVNALAKSYGVSFNDFISQIIDSLPDA